MVFKKDGKLKSMGFHCSEVRKPLGAVSRICEKGNIVQFGPEEKDCFIQNIKSKEKIPMKIEKGTYVIEVNFLVEDDLVPDAKSGFTRPV